MSKPFKNLTSQQKEHILDIIDNFLSFDDVDNLKDFLFDLQNKVLYNTAKVHYTEKGADEVTSNFSILYNLISDLKKIQRINDCAVNQVN